MTSPVLAETVEFKRTYRLIILGTALILGPLTLYAYLMTGRSELEQDPTPILSLVLALCILDLRGEIWQLIPGKLAAVLGLGFLALLTAVGLDRPDTLIFAAMPLAALCLTGLGRFYSGRTKPGGS